MLREKKLPPIEVFYDSLHDHQYTAADYEFAKKFFGKGRCNNMENYCKIYLASDVMTFLDNV